MMVVAMNVRDADHEQDRSLAAHEIAFAKILAGNEKTKRDRGLKKLSMWLEAKAKSGHEFTEQHFKTIWIGLQYSMYMSDKPLVQEELAEKISKLIHCFAANEEAALLFVRIFYQTITDMWFGIDAHRLDKFRMFVRRFLRQSLFYCREKNWPINTVKKLMKIYKDELLLSNKCLGLTLHIIEIFPEEVAKAANRHLRPSVLMAIYSPFANIIATTSDARLRLQCEEFFKYLMKQTDVALDTESLFAQWRQAGYPGKSFLKFLQASEGEEDDNSDNDEKIDTTEFKCGKVSNEDTKPDNGNTSDEEEDNTDNDENIEATKLKYDERSNEGVESNNGDVSEDEEPEAAEALDPRAGKVDVVLNQLYVSPKSILKLLSEQKRLPDATLKGRRILINLSERFRLLRDGHYPVPVKKVPSKKFRRSELIRNRAKKMLRSELGAKRKKAKLRAKLKKSNKKWGCEKEEGKENSLEPSKIDVEMSNTDVSQSEENYNVGTKGKLKSKKVKLSKVRNSPKTNMDVVGSVDGDVCQTAESKLAVQNPSKVQKKLKNKMDKVGGNSGSPERRNSEVGSEHEIINKKKIPFDSSDHVLSKQPKSCSKMNVMPCPSPKRKRKLSGDWVVEDIIEDSSVLNTQKVVPLEKKDPWTLPLQEGETEIFIPYKKKAVTDIDTSTPKPSPVFWNKAMSKALSPKTPTTPGLSHAPAMPSSGRRISFNLKMNCSQEVTEYYEELNRSPQIPFDAAKKPRNSALKAGLLPTPIHPFYMRPRKMHF